VEKIGLIFHNLFIYARVVQLARTLPCQGRGLRHSRNGQKRNKPFRAQESVDGCDEQEHSALPGNVDLVNIG